MKKQDKNKPLVKADLDNLYNRLDKSFDIKLGKFTDEVLLPAVNDIVSNEIGKHRHEMKNYIDSKLAENEGNIISYIKGDQERDKSWKIKVVNILKRAKITKPAEVEILTNLIK
ncbi:MAG: hypothetical protein ABIB72_02230 [Candidatus Falkowbacteria bacterium]